jgi:hypothetical protein
MVVGASRRPEEENVGDPSELLRLLGGVLPPTRTMWERTAKVVLGKDNLVFSLGPLVVSLLVCLFLGFDAFRCRDL